MKFSIHVPFVDAPTETTDWHPTDATGVFSVLVRGLFTTPLDAIAWARDNLNGCPYEIRPFDDSVVGDGECTPTGREFSGEYAELRVAAPEKEGLSITRCSICHEPAHASETDDLDRCAKCLE